MKKIAFTIVFNGMPFLRKQVGYIPQTFDHWYIIEGPAKNTHDTQWCKKIPEQYLSDRNLSRDGTTEFIDQIARDHDNVTVYRPPHKKFWDGKVEMCNSFIDNVENAILMQIDVDEFWDPNVLKDMFEFCEAHPGMFDCMSFRCNFFLGPRLLVTQKGTYGDMPWDWKRLWIVKQPTKWERHEPPTLKGCTREVSKDATERNGWKFNHYAYINVDQVRFKQDYYGYADAVQKWNNLQKVDGTVDASEYLPWINQQCIVKKI